MSPTPFTSRILSPLGSGFFHVKKSQKRISLAVRPLPVQRVPLAPHFPTHKPLKTGEHQSRSRAGPVLVFIATEIPPASPRPLLNVAPQRAHPQRKSFFFLRVEKRLFSGPTPQ